MGADVPERLGGPTAMALDFAKKRFAYRSAMRMRDALTA
jgi:hypothetical protein